MRSRIHAVVLPSEIGEFADEVQRTFLELGPSLGGASLAGECSPALDVYETDETLEIVVDLPGVDEAAVRLFGKGDAVLIVGEKARRRAHGDSSFHLVERGFGRFARVIRLGRPCDTARARAAMTEGELRMSIPKIAERRSRAVPIAISPRS